MIELNKKSGNILITVFLSLLIGCSTHDSDIEKGRRLFNQTHIGKNNVIGCISCHSLSSQHITVGPSLFGIADRASLMIKDMSAQQYLYQSIINPDAYIVSGYAPAVMFAHYEQELSNDQIQEIISFLMTQKASYQGDE